MVAAAAIPSTTSIGPERLVLLHSPDPIDLGLRLEYATDGRVRIVYTTEDNDHQVLPQPNNGGVVEGTVHNGDIVLEAAGVNMRRPISDHMWKLTEGLMKVAPRPIEIIVATEKIENVASEMDQDGMASVYGASVYGTYYQLELGANAQTTDATLHHLPGEECNSDEEGEQPHPSPEVFRNPFQDINRFGAERRILFHTQSLGVKLHRSPSEGIVRILSVTPYKPFGNDANNNNNDDQKKPVREGPDNGHLEAGDTIFEVGGVDLRGKVIGKLEWADMVHFIKHVHRPLEIIVAKDTLFTLERADVITDVVDDLSHTEAANVVDHGRLVVVEDKEDNDEQRDDPESNNEHIYENTCFNIAVDDVCNLPCGGGRSASVTISPTREDTSWIKPSLPESKVHPWKSKKDVHDENTESVIEEVASSANKNAKEQDAAAPNNSNNDDTPDSRPAKMHFFSRTDPKGKPSPVHTSSPVMPISPMTTVAPSMTNHVVVGSEVAGKTLTVSQLREMFSPIQSMAPKDGTSIIATTNDEIKSTILKPVALETSKHEQACRSQLNGLFSPIVANTEDTSAPESPGDWSTKDPLSDKSIQSPVADSGVADVPRSGGRNDGNMEDAMQSMVHADGLFEIVTSGENMEDATAINIIVDKDEPPSIKDKSRHDTEDFSPPVINITISKEELVTVPRIVEAPTNDSKSESRPHMPFYARTHPKSKSSVVQQASPVRASPIARTVVASGNQIQAPTPESSPPKPYDETKDSSFHSTILHDLKDEFNSHDNPLRSPESRDDRAEEDASKTEPGVVSLNSNQLLTEWSVHQHPEKHDLSPTGSTFSVEDKTSTAKKSSADATFFSERFFNTMDAADSPFVGNIKFSTPNQRVPASALFSEAFIVQKPGITGTLRNEPNNVRWVQTNSPLFVTKKKIDDKVGDVEVKMDTQPSDNNVDDLLPIPDVKRFSNTSALDMSKLEGGLSLVDNDPESESPSFELNETIVYADSTEEAQQQCCAVSNLCGSDTMFEGLVQKYVDIDYHRQTKERLNKIPSPRRKNILARIRNKKKKSRLDSEKMEYGTLDDDDSSGMLKEGKIKGIRKAKVQLTFQNMRGQTLASATQFALLMDDEISF